MPQASLKEYKGVISQPMEPGRFCPAAHYKLDTWLILKCKCTTCTAHGCNRQMARRLVRCPKKYPKAKPKTSSVWAGAKREWKLFISIFTSKVSDYKHVFLKLQTNHALYILRSSSIFSGNPSTSHKRGEWPYSVCGCYIMLHLSILLPRCSLPSSKSGLNPIWLQRKNPLILNVLTSQEIQAWKGSGTLFWDPE